MGPAGAAASHRQEVRPAPEVDQTAADRWDPLADPHRRAVAAGGWTQMASVRVAKSAVIDALSFSPVVQPGVTGAALLASYALAGPCLASRDLAGFIREGMQ